MIADFSRNEARSRAGSASSKQRWAGEIPSRPSGLRTPQRGHQI